MRVLFSFRRGRGRSPAGEVSPIFAQETVSGPVNDSYHLIAYDETVVVLLTTEVDADGCTGCAVNPALPTGYVPDDEATITATPGDCWTFSHWGGNVPEEMVNDSPLIVPVTHNRTIFAHFIPPEAEIDSMSFSGDGPLNWDDEEWTDDTSESDDVAIPATTPHWAESGFTKPLCVIKEQSPGISVVLESPVAAWFVTKLKCEWAVDSTTLTYLADVHVTGGTRTVELTKTGKVPNRISNGDSEVKWSVSCDGGTTWVEKASGTIKTFVIYGTPNANEDLEDPQVILANRIDFGQRLRDLCCVSVDIDDGLSFDENSIELNVIGEHRSYSGVHATLNAGLATAKLKLQIDVGFGDVVTPAAERIAYPVLLDFPAPWIRAYTRESVFAEKLHAMVTLGLANSRMKDFYDILVILERFSIENDSLARAINMTFSNRKTLFQTVYHSPDGCHCQ